MTRSIFAPITLDNINGGAALDDARKEFEKLTKKFTAYCARHGESACGAKAKLTFVVSMCQEKSGGIVMLAQVTATEPNRPARVSLPMKSETQDGSPCLMVNAVVDDNELPKHQQLMDLNNSAEPEVE